MVVLPIWDKKKKRRKSPRVFEEFCTAPFLISGYCA